MASSGWADVARGAGNGTRRWRSAARQPGSGLDPGGRCHRRRAASPLRRKSQPASSSLIFSHKSPASLASVQRTGGELVLDSLKAAGVDTVFGIISVHNIPIFDAMAREGGVRLVPARTEHGAAAMADGVARATGRLAAVVTSTGVGAGNAAGSLLEAYSASSPVVHVTGQVEAAFVEGDKGFLHGVKDQFG